MVRSLCLALAFAALLAGCQPPEPAAPSTQPSTDQTRTVASKPETPSGWEARLAEALPEFGHRNWIVVADSAFPTYTDPAIQTVVTNEDHVVVVEKAMKAIEASIHVRPVIYLDKELEAVPDSSAPGADAFRKKFDELRAGADVTRILHEELLAKLARVGKTYKILVLKTNGVVPYTTVFMELNAKYWSASQEAALREALGQKSSTAGPKPEEPKPAATENL